MVDIQHQREKPHKRKILICKEPERLRGRGGLILPYRKDVDRSSEQAKT